MIRSKIVRLVFQQKRPLVRPRNVTGSSAAASSLAVFVPRPTTPTKGTILSHHQRLYSSSVALQAEAAETVPITYVEPDGTEREVQAEIGKNLLEVAHENNVELEANLTRSACNLITGACGGELACSTCHLIFEKEIFDTLPPMEDDEEDMLDLAFEVTETSRLGCQIQVREDFAGMKVEIPDDGF